MRLGQNEKKIILEVIRGKDPEAEIRLYGSRVREDLAGGDIDLLVISETLFFSDKLEILSELKFRLGDQKIDLTLTDKKGSMEDAFILKILPTSELIGK